MSKMSKIKVGIIGIGNCAKSLVEGIQYYKANPEDKVGLMYPDIGGYTTTDIEFVVGFDVDRRKVNRPLTEALRAAPNCAMNHVEEILEAGDNSPGAVAPGAMVYSGPELDGIAPWMLEYPKEVSFRTGAAAAKSYDDIFDLIKNTTSSPMMRHFPAIEKWVATIKRDTAIKAIQTLYISILAPKSHIPWHIDRSDDALSNSYITSIVTNKSFIEFKDDRKYTCLLYTSDAADE